MQPETVSGGARWYLEVSVCCCCCCPSLAPAFPAHNARARATYRVLYAGLSALAYLGTQAGSAGASRGGMRRGIARRRGGRGLAAAGRGGTRLQGQRGAACGAAGAAGRHRRGRGAAAGAADGVTPHRARRRHTLIRPSICERFMNENEVFL